MALQGQQLGQLTAADDSLTNQLGVSGLAAEFCCNALHCLFVSHTKRLPSGLASQHMQRYASPCLCCNMQAVCCPAAAASWDCSHPAQSFFLLPPMTATAPSACCTSPYGFTAMRWGLVCPVSPVGGGYGCGPKHTCTVSSW